MVDAPHQNRLDPPIDAARDHLIGTLSAPITLVEYGSYACEHCHAAHQVVMASLLAACAGFVILRLSSAVQPVRLQADG